MRGVRVRRIVRAVFVHSRRRVRLVRMLVSHPFRRKMRNGWGTHIVRVRRIFLVLVCGFGGLLLVCDHVHFGCGQAASAHLAHLQPRAHIQRGGRFLKTREGNARIHQRAQQHVAAYAGKTLQVQIRTSGITASGSHLG
jgi:hypothetical protein